jgi:DNA phosphorothioation-dependent restriction protein DptG
MSDSVEYMKNQARLALEKGDKQSSAVLTLCAGFLETVEEADSLRTQLAEATRKLEEASKDAERWRTYENIRAMKDNICDGHVMPKYAEDFIMANLTIQDFLDGSTKPEELRKIIDQAIEQGKGGDDGK